MAIAVSVIERSPSSSLSDHRLVMFGPRPKAAMPKTLIKHVYGNKCVPVYSPDADFLIYAIEASGGDVSNSILISLLHGPCRRCYFWKPRSVVVVQILSPFHLNLSVSVAQNAHFSSSSTALFPNTDFQASIKSKVSKGESIHCEVCARPAGATAPPPPTVTTAGRMGAACRGRVWTGDSRLRLRKRESLEAAIHRTTKVGRRAHGEEKCL